MAAMSELPDRAVPWETLTPEERRELAHLHREVQLTRQDAAKMIAAALHAVADYERSLREKYAEGNESCEKR